MAKAKSITTMSAVLTCTASDFSAKMQGGAKSIDAVTAAASKADASLHKMARGQDVANATIHKAATFEDQVTKAIKTRTEAMERAANKAKVLAEANRRMFGNTPAALAEAEDGGSALGQKTMKGFLSELNSTFGKRSTMMKFTKLLMGGGVVGGLAYILNEVFAGGTAISKMLDEWTKGTVTFGQAMKDAWSHVPIFGKASEFGREVGGSAWMSNLLGTPLHQEESSSRMAAKDARESAAVNLNKILETAGVFPKESIDDRVKDEVWRARVEFEKAFPKVMLRSVEGMETKFPKFAGFVTGPATETPVFGPEFDTGRRVGDDTKEYARALENIERIQDQLAAKGPSMESGMFGQTFAMGTPVAKHEIDAMLEKTRIEEESAQAIEEARWANIRAEADWKEREEIRQAERIADLTKKYTHSNSEQLLEDFKSLGGGPLAEQARRYILDELRDISQGSGPLARLSLNTGEGGMAMAQRYAYESGQGLDKLHDAIPQKQLDEQKKATEILASIRDGQKETKVISISN